MIRPCSSRSTSGTRTSRSGRSGTGARRGPPRRDAASGTADELELLVEGLLRLDDAAFADVSAVACASVVPAVSAALESVTARRDRPLLLAGAGTVPMPIRVDRPGDVGRTGS
jgi:pantothenate kinase type III